MTKGEMFRKLAQHYQTDQFRIEVASALIEGKTRRSIELIAKGYESAANKPGQTIHRQYRLEIARILRQVLEEFPEVKRFYGIRI